MEKFEAGIELVGTEVKAIKQGRIGLDGAYVIVRGGEAYLTNADIAAYQPANAPANYEAKRLRRLLPTKKEIARLAEVENQSQLTIIPLSVYSKGRSIKLTVAIARGKKKHDKRETIKKREAKKQIERTLKTS